MPDTPVSCAHLSIYWYREYLQYRTGRRRFTVTPTGIEFRVVGHGFSEWTRN